VLRLATQVLTLILLLQSAKTVIQLAPAAQEDSRITAALAQGAFIFKLARLHASQIVEVVITVTHPLINAQSVTQAAQLVQVGHLKIVLPALCLIINSHLIIHVFQAAISINLSKTLRHSA